MNNDKRIILAIAVYAAVITMVLHTLSSEGHERFSTTEQPAQYQYVANPILPLPSTVNILCTDVQCMDEEKSCYQPRNDFTKDDAPDGASREEVVG